MSRPDLNPRPTRPWSSASRRLRPVIVLLALLGGPVLNDQAYAQEEAFDAVVAEVDAILEATWQSVDLEPSEPASDTDFVRRIYLDLIGRIPTVAEAEAFLRVKGDATKNRRRLVADLLESPEHSEHFATVWANILVGRGGDNDYDRDALHGWLADQFAQNRPWDEMARDLIAAEGRNSENGAINYVLAHRQDDAVPLTSVTTRVFLGKQLQCCQCHDHPTNDWKQEDFWSLNAFFRGIRVQGGRNQMMADRELTDADPVDWFVTFERRNATYRAAIPRYLDGTQLERDRSGARREALAEFIAGPEAGEDLALAFVNRVWAQLHGRGVVHPVDDFGDHNPPAIDGLLETLADAFRDHGYDVRELLCWIAATRTYQASSLTNRSNALDSTFFSHMPLRPMSPEQLFASVQTATGTSDDRPRRDFLETFASAETERTGKYAGTIPQALLLMNGSYINGAVKATDESFTGRLLARARAKGGSNPDLFVINNLYMAALTRRPTRRELSNARALFNDRIDSQTQQWVWSTAKNRGDAEKILKNYADPAKVTEDLFWALLNANEFLLIR